MMNQQRQAVQPEEIPSEDTMYGKYLVFHLDHQEYAIAIEYVTDIIHIQPHTKVPGCPDYVLGITNLRGKVIPVVDLRLRFGKAPQPYNDRTCIVVVSVDNMSVGLVIDSVSEVISLEDSQISPPPLFSTDTETRFVHSVGNAENGVKLILDCRAVLGEELPPERASVQVE